MKAFAWNSNFGDFGGIFVCVARIQLMSKAVLKT